MATAQEPEVPTLPNRCLAPVVAALERSVPDRGGSFGATGSWVLFCLCLLIPLILF